MQYVTFTENNSWEGETWHFYIPLQEASIQALQVLASVLSVHSLDSYVLDLDPVDSSYVDKVVEKSRSGYMAYHNKCEGTLRLPNGITHLSKEDLEKLFYKGHIEDFVKP